MIELFDVSKKYEIREGNRLVLDKINCQIKKGEHVGILGKNGAGKSTLIRLISGSELPTSGIISRRMSISWPLAFSGGFQGSLTGLDNLRFVCRIYNTSYRDALPFVEEFTELGKYLREPVKRYSSGMRAKLAFAISMAIEFDCFLIDEVTAVGDSDFQRKCHIELFERRRDRAMVIVSHDSRMIREHCTRAYVLDSGKLLHFTNTEAAYNHYESPTRQSD
ncbi:ABC transporter ATP-binding protein [Burkholderia pseudomultivorans]|uniref:ATP-binding protein n=1 Tax=Burkholderia pseudomultivorans TaxID=1207504 RepID=A0A132ECW3_9BURK|nr:ABC transporter ATP-binding protein [Burkholderia pseudomultivorans]KWF24678.1 ATP-binding protein [Burkholderia pseudomultivorans]